MTKTPRYAVEFRAKLWKYLGAGGWHFVTLPKKFSPPVTHAWNRTPTLAVVDGHEWKTSVWRGKDGRSVLAVPKRFRGSKGDGDYVRVNLEFISL